MVAASAVLMSDISSSKPTFTQPVIEARPDRDALRRGAGARGRADDRGGGLSTCYLLLQGRSGTGHSVGRGCSLSCWHGKKREKRRFTTWGAPGTPRGLHWNIHTGARHSEQGSWGE